jgi:hypothetical protein
MLTDYSISKALKRQGSVTALTILCPAMVVEYHFVVEERTEWMGGGVKWLGTHDGSKLKGGDILGQHNNL